MDLLLGNQDKTNTNTNTERICQSPLSLFFIFLHTLSHFHNLFSHFPTFFNVVKLSVDDESSLLIFNVYMPCDNKGDDANYQDYVDVMREIEQMILATNSTYVLCGGDFNTDIMRNSLHSLKLLFLGDFNMGFDIQSDITDVPNTFICNATGATSKIDHIVVSDNAFCKAITYNIIDNDLH